MIPPQLFIATLIISILYFMWLGGALFHNLIFHGSFKWRPDFIGWFPDYADKVWGGIKNIFK